MSPACLEFRLHLERSLSGRERASAQALRTLSWHEHLPGCHACRELLAAEEALESLLATLPQPRLPAGMAERVLACLAREREAAALDELLERAAAEPAPLGLARRVLAGLEGVRAEAALDRLLELVPSPALPVGLAGRVLAALEHERSARTRAPVPRALSGWRRAALPTALRLAAALALLVGGFLGVRALLNPLAPGSGPELADAPPPELLESLDLLESWDLLTDDSLDATLTSLDAVDELLLQLEGGNDPLADETDEPSKG